MPTPSPILPGLEAESTTQRAVLPSQIISPGIPGFEFERDVTTAIRPPGPKLLGIQFETTIQGTITTTTHTPRLRGLMFETTIQGQFVTNPGIKPLVLIEQPTLLRARLRRQDLKARAKRSLFSARFDVDKAI